MAVTMADVIFALSLQRAYNFQSTPIAYGYETANDGTRHVVRHFQGNPHVYALDFKSYDKRFPAWLISVAFAIILLIKSFHMLQPIYNYLRSIGTVNDKRGKQIYIANHDLPTAVYQGRTEYHSAGQIGTDGQCKYEELPTLGIFGNLLMASTSSVEIPPLNIPILPENTLADENLKGSILDVG